MKKLFLFLWLTVAALASEKPNIILIMVDDMGRDWVSCYGAKHPTPNIDQLQSRACVMKQPGAPPFAPLPVSRY